ncbi:MAG: DUF3592 domain-containing protein [Anaerolineae bacterium]|nr:DUF3592 domain-containing protein [Anaerolineae bacterium]
MSDQDVSNATDLLHSLNLIRSENPAERRRGIEGLRDLSDDPRVLQVFEHLYEKDPDPGVRDAAWHAIKRSGPSIPAPVPAPKPSPAAPTARPASQAAPGNGRTRPDSPVSAAPRGLFLLKESNAAVVAQHTRPRKASPQNRVILIGLAGALLLAVGILAGLVLPDWAEWFQLRREGVTIQGEVVSVQADPGSDPVVVYWFALAGDLEDDIHTGKQRVTTGALDRLAEDVPVQVRYLPDNPDISRLADEANPDDANRNRLSMAALLLVGGLFILVAIGSMQSNHDRQNRVLKGQVTACSGVIDGDGDFNFKLRYRFRSPSGQVITAQISQIRNDLKDADLPDVGTPVAVYYKNDRSYALL